MLALPIGPDVTQRRVFRRSIAVRRYDARAMAGVKVLFLNTPTRAPLGADTWVHIQIMRTLDRTSHELHVACNRGPEHDRTPTFRLVRQISDLEVVPVNLGAELSRESLSSVVSGVVGSAPALLSAARLGWYIRRHDIDIIHTSDRPRDALASVLLARAARAKCLIHVHVGWAEWMSPALRWALRRADGLIAVSQFVADSLIESGHDPRRIHVVHNAIDVGQWSPDVDRDGARAEIGADRSTAVVLTACRLFPSKGPAELIAACARARADHPRLKLIVAGLDITGGEFLAELGRIAEDAGIAEDVAFLGHRDDMPRLMAAADVFAMPSFGEPFGLVYLEAMAMKRPVLALAHGGALEVVEHGVTGLLSQPGDIDGLAANLVSLLDDPARREAMGTRGRDTVATRFTLDRQAAATARVYRQVLGVGPN
jgi:glycosyltransferase involved in cell wall biosynthesis